MRIDILSVVPELLDSPLSYSIVGRAIKKGLVDIHVHNIRKPGIGPRQTVDDYCYGGDAGIDGNNQRGAVLVNFVQRILVDAIALLHPIRNVVSHINAHFLKMLI